MWFVGGAPLGFILVRKLKEARSKQMEIGTVILSRGVSAGLMGSSAVSRP